MVYHVQYVDYTGHTLDSFCYPRQRLPYQSEMTCNPWGTVTAVSISAVHATHKTITSVIVSPNWQV